MYWLLFKLFAFLSVKCFFYFVTQNYHGVEQEVFLSLPTVLGASGVTEIVQQKLEDSEKNALHKSANVMAEVQNDLIL